MLFLKIQKVLIVIFLLMSYAGFAQEETYWNANSQLTPFRIWMPAENTNFEYIDLDQDGDPDVLRYNLQDGTPVQWIDDDDDMKWTDKEGDTDSDCLMIDINRDGKYGHQFDLNIDWNDENGDGQPDMQVIVDNGPLDRTDLGPGHYMITIDTDEDKVFNYIDWNQLKLKAWNMFDHNKFFQDYSGQSLFLKVHTSVFNINDPSYNWENPFLFYDPDGDNLTEMAIRLVDEPKEIEGIESRPPNGNISADERTVIFKGRVDFATLAFDLDNDNGPDAYNFDFDMSYRFVGEGFSYHDQVHEFSSMRGLPEADKYFYDPRWRQLTKLHYTDHDAAWDLLFKEGDWESIWFVFDEDDDSNRWERVEFYSPLDPFKSGHGNGGLDHKSQTDYSGDRGEWDTDNSGNGKLYISKFDGRLHLYGAEWGAWRIDQQAKHRFHRRHHVDDQIVPEPPEKFATIKYTDTDDNGFLDLIAYDIDGDFEFENTVSLKELGIDDNCELIDPANMKYDDFNQLHEKVANGIWEKAEAAVKAAELVGLNTMWYAFLKNPLSIREKYNFGYWLNFYLYHDIKHQLILENSDKLQSSLDKAYYSGNWNLFINEYQKKI